MPNTYQATPTPMEAQYGMNSTMLPPGFVGVAAPLPLPPATIPVALALEGESGLIAPTLSSTDDLLSDYPQILMGAGHQTDQEMEPEAVMTFTQSELPPMQDPYSANQQGYPQPHPQMVEQQPHPHPMAWQPHPQEYSPPQQPLPHPVEQQLYPHYLPPQQPRPQAMEQQQQPRPQYSQPHPQVAVQPAQNTGGSHMQQQVPFQHNLQQVPSHFHQTPPQSAVAPPQGVRGPSQPNLPPQGASQLQQVPQNTHWPPEGQPPPTQQAHPPQWPPEGQPPPTQQAPPPQGPSEKQLPPMQHTPPQGQPPPTQQAPPPTNDPSTVYGSPMQRVTSGPMPHPPSYEIALTLPSLPPTEQPLPPPISTQRHPQGQPGHVTEPTGHMTTSAASHVTANSSSPGQVTESTNGSLPSEPSRPPTEEGAGLATIAEVSSQFREETERVKELRFKMESEMGELTAMREHLVQGQAELQAQQEQHQRRVEQDRREFEKMKKQYEQEVESMVGEKERYRQLQEAERKKAGERGGMAEQQLQQHNKALAQRAGLPEGWEKRLDQRTGRYYYVDHSTLTTHWNPPAHLINYQRQQQQQDEAMRRQLQDRQLQDRRLQDEAIIRQQEGLRLRQPQQQNRANIPAGHMTGATPTAGHVTGTMPTAGRVTGATPPVAAAAAAGQVGGVGHMPANQISGNFPSQLGPHPSLITPTSQVTTPTPSVAPPSQQQATPTPQQVTPPTPKQTLPTSMPVVDRSVKPSVVSGWFPCPPLQWNL